MLKISLSDDYTLFHNVQLTRDNGRHTISCEIDHVIVNQSGEVLIIEQKNGALYGTAQGLVKRDNNGSETNLVNQLQSAVHTVRNCFKTATDNNKQLIVNYLLYCPDYKVLNINNTGIDSLRYIDATNKDLLSARVDELLTPGNQSNNEWRNIVIDFFSQELIPNSNRSIRS